MKKECSIGQCHAIAAPLTLSAHTWSSLARTPGIWGYSYPHDETTNFNVDFPAPASRKVATKPTRFVLITRAFGLALLYHSGAGNFLLPEYVQILRDWTSHGPF